MIPYCAPLRAAVMAFVAASAVSAAAYNIRGIVTDPDGEPLIAATVKLLAAKDSTFIYGLKSSTSGAFNFDGVGNGKYIISAEYLGFATTYRNVAVSGRSVRLDSIRLNESDVRLNEVVVTGVKSQIKLMEDTVEYNAGSFKTQPNSVVEDLLKRLPGVEVDSDGKITAQGKTVSKILVDGKEFFGDDPKVASKNLPVDMIEKLQVVDRKSDLARLTGVDDGEEETVINLTVKKGMKNGWFGTVEGGYGTMGRYNSVFNVNRFWNDNQITFLGNFNNVNQLGFTDSNGNRFRRFGGAGGISTSQAFGVNFNVGNKEIFRVGGNVMYSHSDRTNTTAREREYLFGDSASYSSIGKYTRDRGHNVSANFRVQWNPNDYNSLEFRPRFSYNINDSESLDSTINYAGNLSRSIVSRSFNTSDSHGKSFEWGARLIYNHKFKNHPGRSVSVDVNYNHSNVNEDENSFSRNIFYLLNDSIDLYDQFTDNHTWSDNVSGRLTWKEPLGDVTNGRFLTIAYRMNYRWNNADKLVYDHPVLWDESGTPVIDEATQELNSDLSNRFRNNYMAQDIRVGFQQVTKTMNLEAGLSLVPSMSKSTNLIDDAKNIPARHVLNFAPFVRYRHRFSKSRSLNIRYNGRSSQPSMNQLQPVPDMSDPMNVVIGNPDLKPTFTHNMMVRFQDFNMEAQRSIMFMANASVTQNSIISNVTRDQATGAQSTRYTNVNGVWNGMFMNLVSMPLGNRVWQFSNHTFFNYSRSVGFNNGERNVSNSMRVSISPAIAFRPENLEFELRPRYSLQNTRNSVSTNGNLNVHNYGGTFSAYYRTPINIILASDVTYTATAGYSKGYDKNEWMWNASISYETLRDRSLVLSVKAYDLLQQRSSISRTATTSYIEDVRTNTLTRYFMFTVAYRFNTFGKGNQPKGRGMMRYGAGGPPHGMGRR